jgi:hypothetical protein
MTEDPTPMASRHPRKPSAPISPARRPHIRLAWAVVAGLVLASSIAQAGIYRWKDSHGVTHYSQSPPAVEAYQTVKGPPPPSRGAHTGADPSQSDGGQSQTPQAQQQAQADQAPKLSPAQRQQKCTYEQSRLAALQRRPRVLLKYPDGHVKRLSEEERQAEITNTQNRVNKYCGD